ncbi:MAG TPA: NAD(P)H-dependent oxidoreductase [Candidatus Paenibacillus intestinavium]|nr:NAD(P)H-dependent oxidoreductase [Candidatus Paenibacillus intestinavium]
MNMLVIYTHPNHQSYNYSLFEAVIKGAKENKTIQDIRVLDLYEEKFNPVLFFDSEHRRRDMHKDPLLEKYREQLLWADKIVMVYPIWWGRPPAMLLGYIDQLFASEFAYRDKKGLLPEGLLKGKSVVCISTMKGPTLYPLLWLNNAHKILMRKALFNFVGIKKVKFFEFGFSESPKGKHVQKQQKIYRYFNMMRA